MDFVAEEVSEEDRKDYWRRYEGIIAQQELPFGEETKSVNLLPPADNRFHIHFRCDDTACTRVHDFSVLDWEVDALYVACRRRSDSCEQAHDKLRNVCGDDKNTHFFLGNMFSHPHVFTIVGLWYPKKRAHKQLELFS